MKQLIRRILKRSGIEIRRSAHDYSALPYNQCLQTLLSCLESLHVVEIGANDGRIGDPLFDFVAANSSRVSIMLIEPQEALIPHLKQNYSFHTRKTVVAGAVGPKGPLDLYSVSAEVWNVLDLPYARGWPPYRAPTGVTSVDRGYVREWLSKHLRADMNPDRAIVKTTVHSEPLPEILAENQWPTTIDVLQVDAEGFDDEAIYNSGIAQIEPRLALRTSVWVTPRQLRPAASTTRLCGTGSRS